MTRQFVSVNVRDARQALRLSQTSVAKYLGLSRQTFCGAESGRRAMTFDELHRLADLYRVPVDAFGRPRARPNGDEVAGLPWAFDVAGVRLLDGHDVAEIQAFVAALRTEARPRSPETPGDGAPVDHGRRLDPGTVADDLRTRLALASPPINVHKALASHDIRVRVAPLHTLSGAFIPESADHRAGVLVNANQPWLRQRASAAHELGHLLLGHATRRGSQILSPLGRRMTPRELDADEFAAELLMPAGLVREELRGLSASRRPVEGEVCRLASRFLVSAQAMVCRLVRLDVLTPLDKRRLLSKRPRDADPGGEAGPGSIAFDAEAFGATCDPAVVTQAVRTPDGVRALQDMAFEDYSRAVPATERRDAATEVYEKVAFWVAARYPQRAAS